MFNSGFIPSVIDGTENEFVEPKNKGLLKEYSYKKYLPDVLNQGRDSICVPCSLSANINWHLNLDHGKIIDNKVKVYDIYESRTAPGDNGMTFKDAFKYLMEEGVETKRGNFKIKDYAIIHNVYALKFAIIANGPCVAVLPVHNADSADEFWNEKYGDFLGYHAVAVVGYNEDGFIIRNSWGSSYGSDGYTLIKNKDINKFKEIWTIYA